MADMAQQSGKMVEHLKSKSTHPRCTIRWGTLYSSATLSLLCTFSRTFELLKIFLVVAAGEAPLHSFHPRHCGHCTVARCTVPVTSVPVGVVPVVGLVERGSVGAALVVHHGG